VLARNGAALVRLEGEERSRLSLECLSGCLDANAPVDHEHECMLLDLVLAELLTGVEPDQYSPRRLVRVEDDR
jgi:hypothetical protein